VRTRYLVTEEERDSLAREVAIHRGLEAHPRIVTLYDVYEEGAGAAPAPAPAPPLLGPSTPADAPRPAGLFAIRTPPTAAAAAAAGAAGAVVPPAGSFVYLVLERVAGGSLSAYMQAKSVRAFAEWQARLIADQLLEALDFLHARGILHGDMKPSNVLVEESSASLLQGGGGGGGGGGSGEGGMPAAATPQPGGGPAPTAHRRAASSGTSMTGAPLLSFVDAVKLCDFGNARRSRDARYYKVTGDVSLVPWSAVTGTMGYVAPEILARKHYGTAADLWSLGVILYELLAGHVPWHPYSDCLRAPPSFDHPPWTAGADGRAPGVSREAAALCRALLTLEPARRITAHAARAHPWFNLNL
jgi:serine/threonine protein kinase